MKFDSISHLLKRKCQATTIFLPFATYILFNRSASVIVLAEDDNVVLYAMSRLIVNQFIAIGSRYGITSYRISSNMLRLKVWDSFALAVMDSI